MLGLFDGVSILYIAGKCPFRETEQVRTTGGRQLMAVQIVLIVLAMGEDFVLPKFAENRHYTIEKVKAC